MELLRTNRKIIRFCRKMLWMKKHQPAKYRIISAITDGMILGTWCLISVGGAIWMTIMGYTTFDSALMGVALLDANIAAFSSIICPEVWES